MINLLTSKRLKRAKDKDIVFEILDVKKNKKTGFFHKMTDIYVFALALGIKEKKMEPLSSGFSESIAVDYFTEEQQKYFDTVILFHEAGNINKLNKSDENNIQVYMKTIEEYTNGGLSILKEKLSIHQEDAFNIISRLVYDKLDERIPSDVEEDFEW
jgi:dnd system-associated protein 4